MLIFGESGKRVYAILGVFMIAYKFNFKKYGNKLFGGGRKKMGKICKTSSII